MDETIDTDTPDNVALPRWLVPTVEPIKYSFVLKSLNHHMGWHASQEYTKSTCMQ